MLFKNIRSFAVLFVVSISVTLSLSLWAQPQHKSLTTQTSDDTVLVKFHPGVRGRTKSQAHTLINGVVTKRIEALGVEVVRVPKGSVNAALNAYDRNPNVIYAEPNRTRPLFIPVTIEGNEPGLGITNNFDEQYGLHNTGQPFGAIVDALGSLIAPAYRASSGADINAPEGWLAVDPAATGVAVAVLDSGVACNHLDLAGKCLQEINFVDAHGSPLEDVLGHGTHVAGILAATTDNSIGIAGVAPDAQIGAYKVCWEDTTLLWLGIILGQCDDDDVAAAITHAADSGLYQVINMSLAGTEASITLENAVNYAWDNGLVIIAGAGNAYATEVQYPAGYDAAIAVAATDYHDNLAGYSTFGNWVDVLAPGTAIVSTVPGGFCGQPDGAASDCYDYKSGTSMSTPHVAGLAAILAAEPAGYSNTEIRNIIEGSADSTGALGQNFQSWVSHGRINMASALNYSAGPATTHSVESIVLDTVNASKGNKFAQATITIRDNLGNPASGVMVSGDFTGDYTDAAMGTTDGNGTVILTTNSTQKGGVAFGFCVSGTSSPDTDLDSLPPCATFP
jgi:thermitase